MIYCADFETTVPRKALKKEELESYETHVWAAGICALHNRDVECFDCIDDFVDCVKCKCADEEDKTIVYFHNLSFDGLMIISWLMKNGWIYKETKRSPRNKQFKCLISDMGQWYSLQVNLGDGCVVEFRDSLKMLPFKLETLAKQLKTEHQKLCGTIDYAKERPEGYHMDEDEKRYLENDVLIMVEALEAMEEFGITEGLTIGGLCMKKYKKIMGWRYNELFPEITKEVDAFCRKSYRGGWCYCKTPRDIYTTEAHYKEAKIDGRITHIVKCGEVYDVNSLYPFVMHSDDEESHIYPVGVPYYFEGDGEFYHVQHRPYIVRAIISMKLKAGHLPSILRKTSRFSDSEYIEECTFEEMTLTKPDVELLFEQYDVEYFGVQDGYYFASATGIFDEYIDYWYHVKATAKNKAVRLFAKLMLNNLYGKMATSMHGDVKVPTIENGVVKLKVEQRKDKKGGYIPVGSFITAYARCKTIRAAQQNYDVFLYADTDSIHCAGKAKGIEVHPSKLGAWKNETSWEVASFIRQKTYIEYTTKKEGEEVSPYWTLRACGAPDECKSRILHEVSRKEDGKWIHDELVLDEDDNVLNEKRTINSLLRFFDIGMEEGGKLLHKTVKGGSVLVPCYFSMR